MHKHNFIALKDKAKTMADENGKKAYIVTEVLLKCKECEFKEWVKREFLCIECLEDYSEPNGYCSDCNRFPSLKRKL